MSKVRRAKAGVYKIDVIVAKIRIHVNFSYKKESGLTTTEGLATRVKVIGISSNEVDFTANHVKSRTENAIFKKRKEEACLREAEVGVGIVSVNYQEII